MELFFYSVKPFFIELVPCIFLMAGDNSKKRVSGGGGGVVPDRNTRFLSLFLFETLKSF